MSVAPEYVAAATSDLSGIGSVIEAASTAAAGPIAAVQPPAADPVSAQIAQLFTGHAQAYQTASVQNAAFHRDFVQTFGASCAAYVRTEATNMTPLRSLSGSATSPVNAARKPLGPLLLRDHGTLLSNRSAVTASGRHLPLAGGHRLDSTGAGLRSGGAMTARNLLAPHEGRNGAPSPPNVNTDPRFPFFHQVLLNQVGYWRTLFEALKTLNPETIWNAVKTVTTQMVQNFSRVLGNLTDFSFFLHGGLRGFEIFFGTPLALAFDFLGAPVNALIALKASISAFSAALHAGDVLGALTAVVEAPVKMANAFLFGQTMLDWTLPMVFLPALTSLEIQVPMGGLFAPLRSGAIIVNGGDLKIMKGTQFGGFFSGIRDVGRQLEQLISLSAGE
ncbi:PE family protein [Mycobacterium genavense]|uniref:PE family protein n=1 Tax=Mycobacterium genavense TaxID=36812 RepID=UPI0004B42BAD|nr:PE family protein [Mycobacterium genavense]